MQESSSSLKEHLSVAHRAHSTVNDIGSSSFTSAKRDFDTFSETLEHDSLQTDTHSKSRGTKTASAGNFLTEHLEEHHVAPERFSTPGSEQLLKHNQLQSRLVLNDPHTDSICANSKASKHHNSPNCRRTPSLGPEIRNISTMSPPRRPEGLRKGSMNPTLPNGDGQEEIRRKVQAVFKLKESKPPITTCELPSSAMVLEPDWGTLFDANPLSSDGDYNSSCDATFRSLVRHATKDQYHKRALQRGMIISTDSCGTQKLPEELCDILSQLERLSDSPRAAGCPATAAQISFEDFRRVRAAQISAIETEQPSPLAPYAYPPSASDFEPGPRFDFDELFKLFNSLSPLPEVTSQLCQRILNAHHIYVQRLEKLRSVSRPLIDLWLHRRTLQTDLAALVEPLPPAPDEIEERESDKERLLRDIAKAQAEHDHLRTRFDELVDCVKTTRANYKVLKELFVKAVLPHIMAIKDNRINLEEAERYFESLTKQVAGRGKTTDQSLPSASRNGQTQAAALLRGQASKKAESSSAQTAAPAQTTLSDARGSCTSSGNLSTQVQMCSNVPKPQVLGKHVLPQGSPPIQGTIHQYAPNQNLVNTRPGPTAGYANQFHRSLPRVQRAPQEDATCREDLQQSEKGLRASSPPQGSIPLHAQLHTEAVRQASKALSTGALDAQRSIQSPDILPSQAVSRPVQVPQAQMSVPGHSFVSAQTNQSPALASQTLISRALTSQPSASQPSIPKAVRRAPQALMVTPVEPGTIAPPTRHDDILSTATPLHTEAFSRQRSPTPSRGSTVRHQTIVQDQSNSRHRAQVPAQNSPDAATPRQLPRTLPLTQHRVPTDQGVASILYQGLQYPHNTSEPNSGVEGLTTQGPSQVSQQGYQAGLQYKHAATAPRFEGVVPPQSLPMTPSNSGSSIRSQGDQVWQGGQSIQNSPIDGPHITPVRNHFPTPQTNGGSPAMPYQANPPPTPQMMVMPGQDMPQSPWFSPQHQMNVGGELMPQITQPDMFGMEAQSQDMALPPQQVPHDLIKYDNFVTPQMEFSPHPAPVQALHTQSSGQQADQFNFQLPPTTQKLLSHVPYVANQTSQEYQGSQSKRMRLG